MSFNEYGPENKRNSAGDEIDFDRINQVSRNVRFYNRVIWAAIFIIIALGAGCGIYLYNYISSGVRGDEPAQEAVKDGGARKNTEGGPTERRTGAQNGPSPAGEKSDPAARPALERYVQKDVSPAPSTHEARPPRDAKPAVAASSRHGGGETLEITAAAVTDEASITGNPRASAAGDTTPAALAKSMGAQSAGTVPINLNSASCAPVTEEISASSPRAPLTTGVDAAGAPVQPPSNSAATSEVAAPAVPQKFTADASKLEKMLAAGRYSEFERETAAALATPGITPESSSRLNMLLAKRAYYQGQDPSSARERLLKVKNISAAGVCDYLCLYLNLFGSASRLRCSQVISYASQSAAALTDAQKVELAGTMARNGFYEDARKMLNRVIASSNFEAEIGRIQETLKKYDGSPGYQAALKARESFEYSIDSTGRGPAPSPVRISRTPVLKLKNTVPVSCFAVVSGAERKLYAYCGDAGAYEISLSVPGRFTGYRLAPESQGLKLTGAFDIRGAQHAAEFERASKYQLAPVNNDAARARYLPPYFEKKEFDHIFIVSADGSRLARFIPDAATAGAASLEIININDRKTLFKADKVFYRPGDTGFAGFSADLVKYSIDEKLECRYFYYFKHASQPGATSETSMKLKLYAADLERLEEKPLLALDVNRPQDLYFAYIGPAGLIMLSYRGGLTASAPVHLKSGSWLINRDISGALFLGDRQLRCAAGDPSAKGLTLYAFDVSRSEIAAFTVSACEAVELIDHAGALFPYFPDYAISLLEDLSRSKAAAAASRPSDARRLEITLEEKKKELAKVRRVELINAATTLLRMGFPSLALERIDGHIKESSSLTDEESVRIMELKKEAEAAKEK